VLPFLTGQLGYHDNCCFANRHRHCVT